MMQGMPVHHSRYLAIDPTTRGTSGMHLRSSQVDEVWVKVASSYVSLMSAKTNLNVEVFFSIGRDIKQRLSDTDSRAEPATIRISQTDQETGAAQATQKSACCGS
ncbi:unnamed protein product [Eruca vesicaria subsp. sativa]|uniref:Uncharacterized protein n=1 Tax=Eruca vesicaria subsp. sativa TaxID=29727 RepID=A0ABC8LBC5_ERUVS|nr:unnamed protein product [Eruca vesicaria subsp. sativa]